MNIVDAGVVVELIAAQLDPGQLGVEELGAPHLIDSEVMHVLRGLAQRGVLSTEQSAFAVDGFTGLTLTRFPATGLRTRMWELRHNLSGYDATYVALAEMTGATSLLTTDARLAKAPGVTCPVRVL